MAAGGSLKNFRAQILLAFVAVFVISWFSIIVATYFNLQEKRAAEQQEMRTHFLHTFDQEIKSYRNAFTASLEFLTHPSRIAHSFTLENKPFFLSSFAVDYANLNQRLGVSHFYFSTASRRNIVRMHAPEKSGDFINRLTTVTAENTGEIASGIEIGRLGSLSYRVVKPIYSGDQLRGFVELGRELDGIWTLIAQQLNISIQVLVNKPFLNKADWLEGKGIFGFRGQWEDMKDRVLVGSEMNGETMPEIMKAVYKKQLEHDIGQIENAGDVYLYSSVPLRDFSQAQIGTILIVYPQKLLTGDLVDDLGTAASASAIALFIGLGICYVLLTPTARNIRDRQARLEKEITHRTHDLVEAKEDAVKAKNSAEVANKAKSEFLSNMSHELRTPLNAIIGFSSIVKNDELREGIGEKYASYADDINKAGSHLLDIINDILDVSRIEAGELKMRFQRLSLTKLMHECHRMVNVRATNRLVPVIHESFDSDIMIDADSTRLKQIILNLLTNAVKFTEPPGTVRLYAEIESPTTVRIVVADEGIGIATEEQAIVLRRFGKAANNALAKQNEEGTGLGLTLVQDLVKQHGGTFSLESELGKGTRVIIRLPISQDSDDLDFLI